MLRPACPHCARPIELTSAAWTSQSRNDRRCPSCGGRVALRIRPGLYALWFAIMMAGAGVALYIRNTDIFVMFFLGAFIVPLFPSMALRAPR